LNIETARPRLSELTSLRFFAALHVMFFHAYAMRAITVNGWLRQISSIGYVGVSLFFVLSGFILVYTYAGAPIVRAGFWRARFARVYPAYLFSLLFCAPFFFYGATHLPIPFFAWASHHMKLASFLPLVLLQSWVPPGAMSWNPVAWSLSVEALFYFLFPFLLPLLAKLSRGALFGVAGLCWAISLSVTGWYALTNPDHLTVMDSDQLSAFWLNAIKFFPLMRLPEFILGMATGLIFIKSRTSVKPAMANQASSSKALAAGLLAMGFLAGAVAAIFSAQIPFAILHTALLAPAFAAIVYGLALQPKWTSFLGWSPLVLLGNASYSFYLLHSNIMGMYFFGSTGQLTHTSFAGIVGAFALVTAASLLVFRFIEEPARRKLRGKTLLKNPETPPELASSAPVGAV
jgi:peptidoglycan/LPS O-acetylase OafA/YrhL